MTGSTPLPMFVLGIDPGKTAGIALYNTELRRFVTLRQAPRVTIEEHLHNSLPHLRSGSTGVIVGERYVPRQYTVVTQELDALEMTGVGKFLARRLGWMFYSMRPSTSKRIVSNETLKTLKLWQTPVDGYNDANDVHDAIRLALAYLAIEHPAAFEWVLTALGD